MTGVLSARAVQAAAAINSDSPAAAHCFDTIFLVFIAMIRNPPMTRRSIAKNAVFQRFAVRQAKSAGKLFAGAGFFQYPPVRRGGWLVAVRAGALVVRALVICRAG